MTPLERPRRSYEDGRGTKAPETDPIDDAVAEWLNQDFFPDKELRKHRHRMGKDCSDIDWVRVNRQETLYISSFFDLCEWWLHVVSMERHTLVYLVLPAIIALPPSNAFLKRIFSSCTWFDGPLRQRLNSDDFKKAVLVAVNECLISGVSATKSSQLNT